MSGQQVLVFEEYEDDYKVLGLINMLADNSVERLPIKGSYAAVPDFENLIICLNTDAQFLFAGRGPVVQQAVRRRIRTAIKFTRSGRRFSAEMEVRGASGRDAIKSCRFDYPDDRVSDGVLDLVYTYILWFYGDLRASAAKPLIAEIGREFKSDWAPRASNEIDFEGFLSSSCFYENK